MMFKLLKCFIVILLFSLQIVRGQLPTEQDCMGAIPICKDVYTESSPYQYSGDGNYLHEIFKPDDMQCVTPEANGVWYTFTAQTSGLMKFMITPDDPYDDYDWILFDLSNAKCSDLQKETMVDYIVSTNNYGNHVYDEFGNYTKGFNGSTGANSDSLTSSAGHCNGPGAEFGPKWNDDILVYERNTYMLYVSNWSASTNGYVIDFSASTAKIYDTTKPEIVISEISQTTCGMDSVIVTFSEYVMCSSIDNNSFTFSGDNSIDIVGIYSLFNRYDAEMDREFVVKFTKALKPGNYTLTLNAAKDLCDNEAEEQSIDFEVLNITINSCDFIDVLCYGESSGEIKIDAECNNKILLYSINGGKNYYENNGEFSKLEAGNYEVYVKNTDECVKTGKTIVIDSAEKIEIIQVDKTDVTDCFGDKSATLSIISGGGTGGHTYSIDNVNKYVNNEGNFKDLVAGKYTVIVKDSFGCTQKTKEIEIYQPPNLIIEDVKIVNLKCFNIDDGSLQVYANGGTGIISYSINSSDFDIVSQFDELKVGDYIVDIMDEKNCKKSKIVTLQTNDKIELELIDLQNSICGDKDNFGSFIVEATGGSNLFEYSLIDGLFQNDGLFYDLIPGSYKVIAQDENLCVSDTLQVSIIQLPCIKIPNMFTPNNDGYNDNWHIENIEYYTKAFIQLFDRWGNKLFQTDCNNVGWDGTFNGQQQPTASYYYYIDLKDGSEPIVGYVTLLR